MVLKDEKLKEFSDNIEQKLNTPEGRLEFRNQLAKYCYDKLDEDHKAIYDKATTLFTEDECIEDVLSVLQMGYLDNPNITKDIMIKAHSELYIPFEVTKPLEWAMDELLKLKTKRDNKIINSKMCQ